MSLQQLMMRRPIPLLPVGSTGTHISLPFWATAAVFFSSACSLFSSSHSVVVTHLEGNGRDGKRARKEGKRHVVKGGLQSDLEKTLDESELGKTGSDSMLEKIVEEEEEMGIARV
ncbi:hypothetical protein BT69DRAFT_1353086 [Atractiella rhizophila]|nr:hypothetical protein BT69DRAFT_1353086 [Atractiella rhizophila]